MRLHWLQPALADLESIGNYLTLKSPSAAERITARIVGAAENLIDGPGIGRPGRVLGTRELVVSGTPYIVVYRVRGQWVELLGVIHGAQQWPEHFD
jgi:toxin ParE1/3/4